MGHLGILWSDKREICNAFGYSDSDKIVDLWTWNKIMWICAHKLKVPCNCQILAQFIRVFGKVECIYVILSIINLRKMSNISVLVLSMNK